MKRRFLLAIVPTILTLFLLPQGSLAQPARREFYKKSTSTQFNPQTLVAEKGRRAAPELIEALSTPGGISPNFVYLAVQQVALTGHPDVALLMERILKGEIAVQAYQEPAIRMSAIAGLVALDTTKARKALAAALSDPNNRISHTEIVEHCGRLQAKECAPAIAEYAVSENRYYDDTLINLAQCSAAETVKLVKSHQASLKAPRLQGYEILALGIAGQPAAQLLVDNAADYQPRRWGGERAVNMAWALGRIDHPKAVTILRAMVQAKDPMTVYFAALSLARHRDKNSLVLIRTASELKLKRESEYVSGGSDSDWGVFRRERIRQSEFDLGMAYARAALGEKPARTKIVQASRDKDAALAMLADSFLLRLGDKTAAKRLVDRIEAAASKAFSAVATDTAWNQSMGDAVWALIEKSPDRGLHVFMRLAEASHWMYKEQGERLVRTIDPTQRIRAMVQFLNRGDFAARAKVRDKLRQMGEVILPELEKAVAGFDQDGRVLAVSLLGEFDDRAGKKILEKTRKTDSAWQVRRTARAALALRAEAEWPPRVKLAEAPLRHVVYGEPEGLPESPVGAVEFGKKVYVAGTNGISVYDGYQWRPVVAKGLCKGEVSALTTWKGKLLVFSKGGLAKGDGNRFACSRWQHPVVRGVLADKGELILGTDKGLYRFDGRNASAMKGTPTRRVTAVVRQGKVLWVGFDLPQVTVTMRYTPALSQTMLPTVIPPTLFRVQGGRFEPVVEPMLAYEGWRLPMDVHSLAAGPGGSLYVGCTEGILHFDGKRWTLLDDTAGYDPRYPVDSIHVSKGGEIMALQGLWMDQRDKQGRWHRTPLGKEGIVEASLLMAERTSSDFLRSNGDAWLVVSEFVQSTYKMMPGMAVRVMGAAPPERKLPPETLVVMAKAGEWRWENPDVKVKPPNVARVSGKGKPVKIPAAQATIEAAAQDPWDYESVSFQFKLDEEPWTPWQSANGILTPLMGEGRHMLRVRAKDASGNVDPTPAVLHFTVHTRELAVVRINDGKFQSVFPAQYRRYEREGVGNVEVENRATQPLPVKINLKIQDLFDTPATRTITIPPGAKKRVNLTAAFTDRILAMTGGAEVQAVVEVEFEFEGIQRQVRRSFPLRIQPVNAFDWSDPARLSGFINSEDPLVVQFGSQVYRAFAKEPGAGILPMRNLALAAYLFRALDAWGVRYKPDPDSPFSAVKPGASSVIDTVRFPAQTLRQKVGDCDDLVVLYASLLEQVGIAAAVVPVEGHVFLLFDSGVLRANRSAFKVPDSLLVEREGSLWIPVEVTWLGREGATFDQAWTAGAEAFKSKYRPRPDAVIGVRESWTATPPVSISGGKIAPPDNRVAGAGKQEAANLLAGYRQAVMGEISGGDDPDSLLEQGRLLAKNGFFDKAESVLNKARAKKKTFEVSYALGVVSAGKRKTTKAVGHFKEASGLSKDNQQRFRASMALATTWRSAGKLKEAKQACDKALTYNPAARFDSKYASLIRFLRSAEKTKAAGEAGPPPYFQYLLSGM